MILIQSKDSEGLHSSSPFSGGDSTYVNSPDHPFLPRSQTLSEPMHVTQFFDHDFENDKGDLIVSSSSNDVFRVVSAVLFEASPFLKTVLDNARTRFSLATTGQISRDPSPNNGFTSMVSFQGDDLRNPVLHFSDVNTETLVHMLRIIYPVTPSLSTMKSLDLSLISSLLGVGNKYQIPVITSTVRLALQPSAGPAQIEF